MDSLAHRFSSRASSHRAHRPAFHFLRHRPRRSQAYARRGVFHLISFNSLVSARQHSNLRSRASHRSRLSLSKPSTAPVRRTPSQRTNEMASHGRGKSKEQSGGHRGGSSAEGGVSLTNNESISTTPQRPRKATSSWVDSQRQRGTKRPPLTHFLCIPLVNDSSRGNVIKSLQRFREDVRTSEEADTGAGSGSGQGSSAAIPEQAIRPIGTLHLTLGVMSLENEERIRDAISFLQNLDLATLLQDALSEVNSPRGGLVESRECNSISYAKADEHASSSAGPANFKISLRSLASMQNPSQTTVLYALPEATSPAFPLYAFCNKLRSAFTSATFLTPEDRPLKLHATVVNTIYAKPGGRHGFSKRNAHSRGPPKIDATSVIEKYRDFIWADNVTIEKVAICKMGAKKILSEAGEVIDEEYEEVASRSMPGISV